MNGALCLARRNVLCYFRDRGSVVFSLMAVIIVAWSPIQTWTGCPS